MKNRLEILRKEHNWTQREVAKKINVTTNSYSRYERGIRLPDIGILKQLSKVYGKSIDYIVCND